MRRLEVSDYSKRWYHFDLWEGEGKMSKKLRTCLLYTSSFIEKVGAAYKDKIGYAADFYVVEIGDRCV